MSERLTAERIKEIAERAELARKGDWIVKGDSIFTLVKDAHCKDGFLFKLFDAWRVLDYKENIDFVSHARQDIPALLSDRAELERERDKAVRSLESAGFTDNGGELWKPPIGKRPPFEELDALRERLAAMEKAVGKHLNMGAFRRNEQGKAMSFHAAVSTTDELVRLMNLAALDNKDADHGEGGGMSDKCKWKVEDTDEGTFATDCGHLHYFPEGGISDNNYKCCPYCGNEIKEGAE